MTTVTLITATTGRGSLLNCVKSVANQRGTEPFFLQHLILIDGPEAAKRLGDLAFIWPTGADIEFIELPYSVGKDRFNGHLMYAAGTYLAKGEYVMYLDDDNTIEPNHVQTCLDVIMKANGTIGWTHSLRRIVDQKGNFICNDDCESLGPDFATVMHPDDRLVDVNCYFLHKTLAVYVSPIWYRKAREPNVPEVDRALVQALKQNAAYASTGKYTVNYAVDSTQLSVSSDFFLKGNAEMENRYPGGFPWRK